MVKIVARQVPSSVTQTDFYFLQRLQDKLREKFHRVTGPKLFCVFSILQIGMVLTEHLNETPAELVDELSEYLRRYFAMIDLPICCCDSVAHIITAGLSYLRNACILLS